MVLISFIANYITQIVRNVRIDTTSYSCQLSYVFDDVILGLSGIYGTYGEF